MFPYILRRLVQFIPTFILATILIFVIIQLAPGDFLSNFKENPRITPNELERLKRQFGLDLPLWQQYLKWVGNMLVGDFGDSFSANRPVLELIIPRAANSMILVGISFVLLTLIAIPVGVYSALKPYSLGDRIFTFFSYFGLGIPSFFFALLAIYAMVLIKQNTGLDVPISGKGSIGLAADASAWDRFWDVMKFAAVPSVILVLRGISSESRFIRGQMLETLGQDYIRTARAKGLNQTRVVYKHAFRMAIIPFIAGLGGLLPGLLGGAGFVEVVFSWPGLTPLILDAIGNQDLYVVASITAISAVLYIIGNLLSDIALAAIDPRISYS